MHDLVGWYNEFQQKTLEDVAAKDTTSLDATLEALRSEWGADLRANVNMVNAHLASAPAGVKERVMGARAADGTLLLNDPAMMNYFAGMAREINPAATLVSGTGNSAAGVEDRIAQIETTMRTNRMAYNRDEKLQAEYRNLIDARLAFARKAG
jgi:hypothetical protein